eukprot:7126171-Alexandrium_andersonii.AAC.1
MSASLVGSEMCIRDRGRTREGAQPGSCERLRASGSGRRFQAHDSRSQGPVSYTHLTLPTICSV